MHLCWKENFVKHQKVSKYYDQDCNKSPAWNWQILFCGKDPFNAKYQLLINKRESTGLGIFNDPKVFIEYSNDMDNIYKTVEDYNVNKKRKIWWYDCWCA